MFLKHVYQGFYDFLFDVNKETTINNARLNLFNSVTQTVSDMYFFSQGEYNMFIRRQINSLQFHVSSLCGGYIYLGLGFNS